MTLIQISSSKFEKNIKGLMTVIVGQAQSLVPTCVHLFLFAAVKSLGVCGQQLVPERAAMNLPMTWWMEKCRSWMTAQRFLPRPGLARTAHPQFLWGCAYFPFSRQGLFCSPLPLLQYGRHRRLCVFNVYIMLTWSVYVPQYDAHRNLDNASTMSHSYHLFV